MAPGREKTELYLEAVETAVAEPGRWIDVARRFETEANARVTANCLEGGYLRVRPREHDVAVEVRGKQYVRTAAPVATRVHRDHGDGGWRLSVRADAIDDEPRQALMAAGFAPSTTGLWLDAARQVGAEPATSGVYVGWVDAAWPGPSRPVLRLHGVIHVPEELIGDIDSARDRARAAREAALRTCRFCGARKTPGHMHSADTCQGCAEAHLGVVH